MLGVFLGIRHAFEPDHLAAVATLVTARRSRGAAAMLGVYWGLGHTASLLAVGLALLGLRSELPPRVSDAFELAVAVMLVVLGARSIRQAWRDGEPGHVTTHRHGALEHTHEVARRLALRPLLVGLVHGLAGSGALTAVVFANEPDWGARLGYIALFGIGSALGMGGLSGLAGWPIAELARAPRFARGLAMAAGTLSAGMGLFWGAAAVQAWAN